MRTFVDGKGKELNLCADVIRAAFAVGGTMYHGIHLDAHTEAYAAIIVVEQTEPYSEVEK